MARSSAPRRRQAGRARPESSIRTGSIITAPNGAKIQTGPKPINLFEQADAGGPKVTKSRSAAMIAGLLRLGQRLPTIPNITKGGRRK